MPPHQTGCCHGEHPHACHACGSGWHYGMWPPLMGYVYFGPQAAYPHWQWGWPGPWTSPHAPSVVLPKELEANPAGTSAEIVVGGTRDVQICLEYMRGDGAETPMVKLSVSLAGSTSTWEPGTIEEGYHVKSDLSKIAPGSKMRLEVQNAIARVRWLEVSGAETSG